MAGQVTSTNDPLTDDSRCWIGHPVTLAEPRWPWRFALGVRWIEVDPYKFNRYRVNLPIKIFRVRKELRTEIKDEEQ